MSAYLRQGGQVSIILSEAEAQALTEVAERGFDEESGEMNGARRKAADRAIQALAASTNRSARVAGYFPE